MYALYVLLTTLAAPVLALALACLPKHRPLLKRFRPPISDSESRPIWIHACSIGEVAAARPLIRALRERTPDQPLVLSVSTTTGKAFADSLELGVPILWFPFDFLPAARRFIRRLHPSSLLLIETEFWPIILHETLRAGIPIHLVNGRISDTNYRSYQRLRALYRPVLRGFSSACMQSEDYASRAAALGANPDRVVVTGNIKFDGAPPTPSQNRLQSLREELGIEPNAPLLVFGSTRPGDESLAHQCWVDLRDTIPDLRILVAPRHLERIEDARAAFAPEQIVLRSASDPSASHASPDRPIILLDTHGELAQCYALATIAIVGGSFYPGVEGHNPIEPAALGVPTVFGPHMANFADAARALVAQGGAVQVTGPEALSSALQTLLSDPEKRQQLGISARQAIQSNQGAVEKTLAAIL